jgi:hypothetical protein
MTAVEVAGAMTGFGLAGLFFWSRPAPRSLEALAGIMSERPVPVSTLPPRRPGVRESIGLRMVDWVRPEGLSSAPRWSLLRSNLMITGGSWEGLTSGMVIGGAAGLLMPPLLWVTAQLVGISLPLGVPVSLALLAIPLGVAMPVVELFRRASRRRRHARSVVATFVDLVILGLAGGVGTEGALFAAVEVSPDWAFDRMSRALWKARDSGLSAWSALGQLGSEIGVVELVELAASLELAGTEGARIRQSLSARSSALRRHEQADAESEANAVTERLFLPGALLLVGFLLFIGYPAFSRIIGGF